MCDELQKKEYAPVHLQDEGASRGATCFHYYHLSFQERVGVSSLKSIISDVRYNGRSRPSYDSFFCVSLRGDLMKGISLFARPSRTDRRLSVIYGLKTYLSSCCLIIRDYTLL